MSVKPRYSELLQHFNVVKGDVSHVGAIVGGRVKLNIDNGDFKNACAIRISYALNKAGITIPYRAGETSSGEDKAWYLYRVNALIEFLIKKLESLKPLLQQRHERNWQIKKGLFCLESVAGGDASGHFTLWDVVEKECTDKCYFSDNHNNSNVSTQSVEFWELLP